MDEKDILRVTEETNQLEKRLDSISLNKKENQPLVLPADENSRVQKSVDESCLKKNRIWKITDQTDSSFSRNASKITATNNLSWRKKVIEGDDKNNSFSGNESRSNAWSKFSWNSRSSSRGRHIHNEKKVTNWRDSSSKTKGNSVEFKLDGNKNKFGVFTKSKRNERNRPEVPNREHLIDYKYLKALSEKQPLEMISEILKPNADINFALNRKELQAEWVFVITKTLRKLCECDFKINRIEILQFFCESPFMNHISNYLGEIGVEKNADIIQSLNSFISNLVTFYSAVIDTIPTVAVNKNFDKFLKKTKIAIDQIETYLNTKIDQTNLEKLESLEKVLENETNIREKKTNKPQRNYLDFLEDSPPPDDFRELNLYPTYEDLNRDDFGFVRPNKIKGAYDDVDHYLDVQFRLIREDFIDPLRRGLRQYKDAIASQNKPKYKYESVRFYPGTVIERIELTARGEAAYVVNFNTNRRFDRIRWECNKWFMFGSLLLFTLDNFNSYFFATVANRDVQKLKTGRILVKLIGNEPLETKMLSQPLLMAESETYFEPYGLVMKALKNFNEYDFPMRQFIVDGDTVTRLPRYIEEISVYGFYVYRNSVSLWRNDSWPHHSEIDLDEHQFDAFKTALTNNFTVIQGPPGTGKTYLGLKIVEVLLHNIDDSPIYYDDYEDYFTGSHHRFPTPILVVCYTNHALDQFLEGILKFTRKIVRVGGQSKSDLLERFNLRGRYNFRELRKEANELYPGLDCCRLVMRGILYKIEVKNQERRMIENPFGILSYSSLSQVMSADFKRIINDEKTLLLWLFNNDPYMTQNILRIISMDKTSQSVEVDSICSVKTDDKIHGEEDEEMMNAADVLVDEDDIFDPQDVKIDDVSIKYCVSLRDVYISKQKTQDELITLNPDLFDDYSKYYDRENQLKETLRITDLQLDILNHYLQSSELNSSSQNNIRNQNLWEMPIDQRWRIYWTLVTRVRDNLLEQLKHLEAEYRYKYQQYEELKQLEDFHIVKNSSIIGMTTTCAARLQLFLKSLNPKIIIVEEAAEVLESHIVVSLNKDCEHVILIGDHKQLKPSSAVYELSKKFNIDVSLFERMINNNMYCPQLQVQHRMREEISKLLVPSIYPELKNHQSVLEYPSVKGISKNLFFVEHNVFEEIMDDSSSKRNEFEAEFIIQLCRYILLQGYKADQITILTTYTGQMFLLREMKRDHAIMEDVKTVVVDKYQGEENDIILLSLVRSNKERNIGFLSIENRVCVALSRAKIGLYIIGNMDILSYSPLWKNIKKELIEQEAIGSKLKLYCDKHDVYTEVSCKSDFKNVPLGGCNKECLEDLDCGHECHLLCHKIEMECREKCLRQCDENHPCTKHCYEECGLCSVPIERNLPCGHTVTLPCHMKNYEEYNCQEEFTVVLEPCSHEVKRRCSQKMENVQCTFPCEDLLKCGHQCPKNCHKTDDPDHLVYKCRQPCGKIFPGCTRKHRCRKSCFEDCGKCNVLVDFTFKCGHSIKLPCSVDLGKIKCYKLCGKTCQKCKTPCAKKCYEDCKPCQNKVTMRMPNCSHENKIACSADSSKIRCRKPCEKKCPECDTVCPKKCYEDCKPCLKKVTKQIPDCGHEQDVECSTVPERKLCKEKCERVGSCGHKCKSPCGEPCSFDQCMEVIESTVQALCGHGNADVQCWKRNEVIDAVELLPYCTEPCLEQLKCGHLCKGTCGSCWQGRFHQTCQEKCKNIFVCGHSCTSPCGIVCPPCVEKCQYSCKHTKCSKNCGVPCTPCKEKCQWQCFHYKCKRKCGDICDRQPCYEPCPKKLSCKHACIGFCGEPCPKKCRICHKTEVTTIIFGDEDKEDAKFVLLQDCGHMIESRAMDKHISTSAETNKIVLKSCPRCKSQITKTLRYMNHVKNFYRDIRIVKSKVYGQETEMRQIRTYLKKKLDDLDLSNDCLERTEFVSIKNEVVQYKQLSDNRVKLWALSVQALKVMLFLTNVFSSIISRLDDLKQCLESEKIPIFERLQWLLKVLNPVLSKTKQINLKLVEDTIRELNRYHRLVDYVVYLNQPEYRSNRDSPNVRIISADIVDILYGWKCFKQDARIDELFENLQKEINSGQSVSKKKKRIDEMTKYFNDELNIRSDWFSCKKGHCFVSQCDGTSEKSRCSECHERIDYLFSEFADLV